MEITMKRKNKVLSLILAATLLLGAAAMTLTANAKVNPITGADVIHAENIKLNGQDTGVTLTQMTLTSGSKYSLSREGLVNVIDLNGAKNVTFKVLNGVPTTGAARPWVRLLSSTTKRIRIPP